MGVIVLPSLFQSPKSLQLRSELGALLCGMASVDLRGSYQMWSFLIDRKSAMRENARYIYSLGP